MGVRGVLRRLRRGGARRPRVLCTLAIGPHVELLALSEPTFRAYAERHGFDLVVARESQFPGRPVAWSKVVLIRRLMRDYDLVVWVDVDTMILDPSRDIADALVPGADIHLVEHRYHDQRVPNSGVLMVRSTKAADAFLGLVWGQEQYIDHPWWENAAILDLLGYRLIPCNPERPSPFRDLFGFIGNEWNSISLDPSRAPVIRHYAGATHKERLAGMGADARSLQLDGHLPLEAPEQA